MTGTRRHFLRRAATITIAASTGLFAAGIGAQSNGPACYDPAGLPFTQKSRRRALGYRETSNDAARHCSLCAFYTTAAAGCGTCQMLSGGPVNAGALCNSFAQRSAK